MTPQTGPYRRLRTMPASADLRLAGSSRFPLAPSDSPLASRTSCIQPVPKAAWYGTKPEKTCQSRIKVPWCGARTPMYSLRIFGMDAPRHDACRTLFNHFRREAMAVSAIAPKSKHNQHAPEDGLQIRPGGRRARERTAGSLIRQAKRQGLKQARRSQGGRGRGKHAGRGPLLTHSPQHVVVKVHYYRHAGKTPGAAGARLGRHVGYLQRQAATVDDQRPMAYSAEHDQVEAKDVVQAWEADDYHFRWIISAEHGERLEDLKGYVREVMHRVEQDLETRLEWIAVDHRNTDNPHTHVLVRGVDDLGAELRIHPEYIKSGIRHRASQVATERLGPRDPADVELARRKEVTADRVTGLDRRIEAALDGNRMIDLREGAENGIPAYERGRVIGRLQHLEELGLAREPRHGRWTVAENFLGDLKAIGRQGDIAKRLFERMPDRAAFVAEYEVSGFETPPLRGQVVAKGQHDELGTRNFLVIRDADGRDFYVSLSDKIDLTSVREGSLVAAGPLKLPDGKAEHVILRQARGGVYDPAAHLAELRGRLDDPEAYVARHVSRLSTLERQGQVERLPDGKWRVPPDLVERGLAEAEAMRQNPILQRHTQLSNVSGKPLQELTQARAWTYLDRTLERHPEGLPEDHAYAAFLGKALADRKAWLVEQGYGLEKDGRFAFDARAKGELQAAGRVPERAQVKSTREDRGLER